MTSFGASQIKTSVDEEQTTQEDQLQSFLEGISDLDAGGILKFFIKDAFSGCIAVSSSFGAESAVLLKLVADVDPSVPILFINTELLFDETVAYAQTLESHLGLKDVQVIRPLPLHLENADADGTLHQRDPDYCCHIRKVLPFENALEAFSAWISGRKRFQSSTRSNLMPVELDGSGRFKINPLYTWTHDEIVKAFHDMNLPKHPLVDKGYPSLGCAPCTRQVKPGEDLRAGRWSGQEKTECGLHQ